MEGNGRENPYPGLRPFNDSESAYFFGRDSQRKEIVKRLQSSHFVAVLGGSGSGKSSLIRAGVVPDLRSYALEGSGDFWVPVIFTPGTDLAENRGPFFRLATAFYETLEQSDTPELQVEGCLHELRSENGLRALIDSYAEQLEYTSGCDPRNANWLFVFDQFEEIFHSSNRDLKEFSALVDKVLMDHFRNPHPKAYVVLTMRSEHLNDCARYLHLPDAINEASYLIRRLNKEEIREAIELPPKRFLMSIFRDHRDERHLLPKDISIDDEVIDLLLEDVCRMKDDPDHLPLLQHLLFWLWHVAMERAKKNEQYLPEKITKVDLELARKTPADNMKASNNICRSCLETRSLATFDKLNDNQKKHWALLFSLLAFKDFSSGGSYTQRRVHIIEFSQQHGLSIEETKKILAPFLSPHKYLHFDPNNGLVKVAHESYIRGWKKFRVLVEEQADRYKEFLIFEGEFSEWHQSHRSMEGLQDVNSKFSAVLDSFIRGWTKTKRSVKDRANRCLEILPFKKYFPGWGRNTKSSEKLQNAQLLDARQLARFRRYRIDPIDHEHELRKLLDLYANEKIADEDIQEFKFYIRQSQSAVNKSASANKAAKLGSGLAVLVLVGMVFIVPYVTSLSLAEENYKTYAITSEAGKEMQRRTQLNVYAEDGVKSSILRRLIVGARKFQETHHANDSRGNTDTYLSSILEIFTFLALDNSMTTALAESTVSEMIREAITNGMWTYGGEAWTPQPSPTISICTVSSDNNIVLGYRPSDLMEGINPVNFLSFDKKNVAAGVVEFDEEKLLYFLPMKNGNCEWGAQLAMVARFPSHAYFEIDVNFGYLLVSLKKLHSSDANDRYTQIWHILENREREPLTYYLKQAFVLEAEEQAVKDELVKRSISIVQSTKLPNGVDVVELRGGKRLSFYKPMWNISDQHDWYDEENWELLHKGANGYCRSSPKPKPRKEGNLSEEQVPSVYTDKSGKLCVETIKRSQPMQSLQVSVYNQNSKEAGIPIIDNLIFSDTDKKLYIGTSSSSAGAMSNEGWIAAKRSNGQDWVASPWSVPAWLSTGCKLMRAMNSLEVDEVHGAVYRDYLEDDFIKQTLHDNPCPDNS